MTFGRKAHILNTDRDALWHPFTQHAADEPPLVITRAKGLHLFDAEGRRYDDTISSWWTNLHGHGHPALVKAVNRQIRTLDHVNFSGFTHPAATELVSRLAERLPARLCRFFYSDNGSTAVEVALKMAAQYFFNTGRPEKNLVVHWKGSYHGDTLGALGVGGIAPFRLGFSSLPLRGLQVASPWSKNPQKPTGNAVGAACPEPAWAEMEAVLRENAPTVAAVIVEPLVQCVAGMLVHSAEYLRRLQKLCRELDILVIYDEVATGFGRTGTFFALDQTGTEPDFVCLAKGLSGGVLPLALTVTTQKVFEAFVGGAERTFYHGHSFTANPIACAAGVASLRLFEKDRVLERLEEPAAEFHAQLLSHASDWGVTDVRFLGVIGAVDVQAPGAVLPPGALGKRIYRESLKRGLVLRPLGDTIYWFLPLCVRVADVRRILKTSFEVIHDVLAGSTPQREDDHAPLV